MARIPVFERRSVDLTGGIPQVQTDISGLAKGLQTTAAAMNRYQDRVDKLTLISLNNRLHDKRLTELTNTRINVRKQSAAGITNTERSRMSSERDQFLQDVPDHLRPQALALYDRSAQGFLNQIASHEVSQINAWEADQVKLTGETYSRLANNIKIGDVESLMNLTSEVKTLLSDHPVQADQAVKNAVVTAFQTWSSVEPEMAEAALHANAGKLKRLMGDEYNSVLTAVKQGKQYARAEDEYKHRLEQRAKSEREENTLRQGLVIATDPNQELTPSWIVSRSHNLSPAGVNTLRAIVDAQNAKPAVTEATADPWDYARLNKLVHSKDFMGVNADIITAEVANAMNKTITFGQGATLLSVIAKKSSLTPDQRQAQELLDKLVFDPDNKNIDAEIRYDHQREFNALYNKDPNFDPTDFVNRITRRQQEAVDEWYGDNYSTEISSDFKEFLDDTKNMPYMTPEEELQVGQEYNKLLKINPNIPYTKETVLAILNAIRETYVGPTGRN